MRWWGCNEVAMMRVERWASWRWSPGVEKKMKMEEL